jgi:hypothetical protein
MKAVIDVATLVIVHAARHFLDKLFLRLLCPWADRNIGASAAANYHAARKSKPDFPGR